MNVIVSNKYQQLLVNLDIDVIKSINGEFGVDEIVANFTNFFYNKMILDITAIKNYQDINTIQQLSLGLDTSKIIILLDDSEVVNSPLYLSQLVSMGIYNFTRNVDAIKFLIDNPNSYKDVASYHQLNAVPQASAAPEENNINVPIDNNINSNDTNNIVGMRQRVIAVKNVTEHAGSTTLTYLLKKHLESNYNVVAVEVESNDFVFLNDKTLQHTSILDLPTFIAMNSDKDVILVDLNDNDPIDYDMEILYLIEPGLIKLNKLIRRDHTAFEKLKDKKVILNRSVLSDKDVADFEYESKSKVFFNMPYLDDKLDKSVSVYELLSKLGFNRLDADKDGNIFNIFK